MVNRLCTASPGKYVYRIVVVRIESRRVTRLKAWSAPENDDLYIGTKSESHSALIRRSFYRWLAEHPSMSTLSPYVSKYVQSMYKAISSFKASSSFLSSPGAKPLNYAHAACRICSHKGGTQ